MSPPPRLSCAARSIPARSGPSIVSRLQRDFSHRRQGRRRGRALPSSCRACTRRRQARKRERWTAPSSPPPENAGFDVHGSASFGSPKWSAPSASSATSESDCPAASASRASCPDASSRPARSREPDCEDRAGSRPARRAPSSPKAERKLRVSAPCEGPDQRVAERRSPVVARGAAAVERAPSGRGRRPSARLERLAEVERDRHLLTQRHVAVEDHPRPCEKSVLPAAIEVVGEQRRDERERNDEAGVARADRRRARRARRRARAARRRAREPAPRARGRGRRTRARRATNPLSIDGRSASATRPAARRAAPAARSACGESSRSSEASGERAGRERAHDERTRERATGPRR